MDKTKTVAWMMVIAIVLLLVLVIAMFTKKQAILMSGNTGTIAESNLFKKS